MGIASNETLLDEFVADNYIDSWDKCTSTQLLETDHWSYSIIMFANDQHTSAYTNLGKLKASLDSYVEGGGVFLLGE